MPRPVIPVVADLAAADVAPEAAADWACGLERGASGGDARREDGKVIEKRGPAQKGVMNGSQRTARAALATVEKEVKERAEKGDRTSLGQAVRAPTLPAGGRTLPLD